MSTSPFGARMPFQGSNDAAGYALNTSYALDLANNALHAADECGQVRVNMVLPASTGPRFDYLTIDGGGAIGAWLPIAVFGPFPCRSMLGQTYAMRVRMAGSLSASPGTSQLRAVWSAQGSAYSDVLEGGANVLELAIADSTTPTWNAGEVILTLADDKVGEAAGLLDTPLVLGGDPGSAGVVMTTITVFGRVQTGAQVPLLNALYAAEYFTGDGTPPPGPVPPPVNFFSFGSPFSTAFKTYASENP